MTPQFVSSKNWWNHLSFIKKVDLIIHQQFDEPRRPFTIRFSRSTPTRRLRMAPASLIWPRINGTKTGRWCWSRTWCFTRWFLFNLAVAITFYWGKNPGPYSEIWKYLILEWLLFSGIARHQFKQICCDSLVHLFFYTFYIKKPCMGPASLDMVGIWGHN